MITDSFTLTVIATIIATVLVSLILLLSVGLSVLLNRKQDSTFRQVISSNNLNISEVPESKVEIENNITVQESKVETPHTIEERLTTIKTIEYHAPQVINQTMIPDSNQKVSYYGRFNPYVVKAN